MKYAAALAFLLAAFAVPVPFIDRPGLALAGLACLALALPDPERELDEPELELDP